MLSIKKILVQKHKCLKKRRQCSISKLQRSASSWAWKSC